MPAAELHITPSRATSSNGLNLGGAKWYFYRSGTTTPQSVYTTSALSVAHSNPVVADAGGKFPPIYFDSTLSYRGILKSADEVTTIYDLDPINTDTLAQLSQNTGAGLIGTSTGATVEARLNALNTSASGLTSKVDAAQSQITALEAATARLQRMSPPYTKVAGVYVADVVPTASSPMAAKRLHADWILVRVRSSTLAAVSLDDVYWDEYYLRNSRGYADVGSGWQLVGWRAYYNSRYSTWLTSPDDEGGIANADFALRLGLYSSSYHSGGEGPAYYFTGFGHGRAAASDADISIIKDGGGSNLNPTAAWPVGTTLLGSTLDFTTNFKLRTLTATLGSNPIATTNGSGTVTVSQSGHGYSTGQFVTLEGVPGAGVNGITFAQLKARQQITVVDANTYTMATGGTATSTGSGGGSSIQVFADVVNLTYTQFFGTHGLRRKGAYSASLAGYGIQDSYGYMLPVNSYEVTHFKANGETAIALTQDSQQKGTSTTGTAVYHQAYNSARPTIIAQMYLEYDQPLRKASGGLSAWGQNYAGRYFFRDLADYAKYYVFINSSEEALPRTAWPMTVNEVFEWQSLLRTEYRAGGPR